MKNITGNPAEGEDFFNRPKELERLERELDNKANLLLTAPRRVGKTSLVIRLCENMQGRGWRTVFVNVEDCGDELGFADKLLNHLGQSGLDAETMVRATEAIRKIRKAVGSVKGGGGGIDLELGDVEDANYSTVAKAVESVFRKVEKTDEKVLIAIDELPEFLLALGRHGESAPERVERFLHWLRALRQTFRGQVHWIFLGSIGLDGFVEERSLGKTVNDLTPATLEALSDEEADLFLIGLSDTEANGLRLTESARKRVVQKIGWALPHHLQLMYHALRDLDIADANEADVNRAFDQLLMPERNTNFDTWRQRLKDQFSDVDAKAAFRILDFLATRIDGASKEEIIGRMMSINADIDIIEEQAGRLLKTLRRDGYLIENAGLLGFRSFLLREFWRNR